MKLKTLTALIVTTYIGFDPVALASAPQPVFTPEQEARIGEIASEYLMAHPEILVTVSQKLQEQQQLRKQKLASAAAFTTASGRFKANWTNQTVLAGVRLRLWLSQDPSRPAR